MRQIIAGVVAVAAGVGTMAWGQTNAPQPAAAAAAPKSWTDNITLKGDLRYRYETIHDDSKKDAGGDTYTRERNRIRARAGLEAKCNDNLKVGIGLSTGQADPVSGNQTIGDGFGKKEMRLDLAYFDYNFFGDNPNEVHAIGGKMKNPFITFPDDLVWDPDLNPEGLAVKTQLGGGLATLLANGGYMWIQERATGNDDTMLYAGQAALRLQFAPEASLTFGASYYGYQHAQGYDVIDWEAKNNSYGNSTKAGTVSGTNTNKAWATEFTPVTYFAQLELWLGTLPLNLYAQALSNTDASRYDSGHMYGLTLGKSKNPGTAEVGYSYAEVQKDATLGMFTDSDRWGGGTNGKGHKLYAKYQLMKNLQLGLAYFLDKKNIATKETDYDRLQVDLQTTF